MIAPEFSRMISLDRIGDTPLRLTIEANDSERAALARRFALVGVDCLSASLELWRDQIGVRLHGQVTASWVQSCAATGADVPVRLEEAIMVRFAPVSGAVSLELELNEGDCDVIEFDGAAVDAGEAIAQSLGLAIDPYLRAPDADAALKAAGVISEAAAGPFAALGALTSNSS